MFGLEQFTDSASLLKDDADPEERGFRKSINDELSDDVSISNQAVFLQVEHSLNDFKFFLGSRYDDNEIYGDSLNPLSGITYLNNDFHSKQLYSEAFRAPLVGNNAFSRYGFDPNKSWRDEVRPEKTKVLELEFGYRFSEQAQLTVNFYDQVVDDVIEFASSRRSRLWLRVLEIQQLSKNKVWLMLAIAGKTPKKKCL